MAPVARVRQQTPRPGVIADEEIPSCSKIKSVEQLPKFCSPSPILVNAQRSYIFVSAEQLPKFCSPYTENCDVAVRMQHLRAGRNYAFRNNS